MEELFKELAGHIALAIEAVAILAIAIGSLEAVVNAVRMMFSRATAAEMRDVWMRYARWLVAGLTFQLAGDIVRTAIRLPNGAIRACAESATLDGLSGRGRNEHIWKEQAGSCGYCRAWHAR